MKNIRKNTIKFHPSFPLCPPSKKAFHQEKTQKSWALKNSEKMENLFKLKSVEWKFFQSVSRNLWRNSVMNCENSFNSDVKFWFFQEFLQFSFFYRKTKLFLFSFRSCSFFFRKRKYILCGKKKWKSLFNTLMK
jgi:hypothetical protein